MNRNEATALIAMIDQLWGERPGQPEAKIAVWADALQGVPFPAAQKAVRSLALSGSTFPPSVADIVTEMRSAHSIPSWAECKALIEASHYGGYPEGTHPIVREIGRQVGGATTLAANSPVVAERMVRSAHGPAVERWERANAQALALDDGNQDSDWSAGTVRRGGEPRQIGM